jgi:hypothetical protein
MRNATAQPGVILQSVDAAKVVLVGEETGLSIVAALNQV